MFKRTNGKPTLICVTFSDRHVFHDFFWFLHTRPLLQLWFKCLSFSVPSELCKLRFIFTASHSGNWRAELEDIFDSALYLACSFFQELLAGCLVLCGKISLPFVSHLRSKRALQLNRIIAKTIKQAKKQQSDIKQIYQVTLKAIGLPGVRGLCQEIRVGQSFTIAVATQLQHGRKKSLAFQLAKALLKWLKGTKSNE